MYVYIIAFKFKFILFCRWRRLGWVSVKQWDEDSQVKQRNESLSDFKKQNERVKRIIWFCDTHIYALWSAAISLKSVPS